MGNDESGIQGKDPERPPTPVLVGLGIIAAVLLGPLMVLLAGVIYRGWGLALSWAF